MPKRASDRILLKNVIASYPNVFSPREKMSGDGFEYSIQIVMPKNHPQLKELQAKILGVAKEAFPKEKPAALKLGLRDNDKEGRSEDDPRLANTMFLNARSQKVQPVVVDRMVRPILDESGFYPGCKINISLSLFSYDNSGSKGVSFGIGNIQVTETGERWDGRKSASDEFEVLDEEEVETGVAADEVEAEAAVEAPATTKPAKGKAAAAAKAESLPWD